MQKGLFIVFEGPDGAGTTTHARLLEERLQREGRGVLFTAEPTEGQYGKKIREALKGAPSSFTKASEDRRGAPTPEELQQIFCVDRAEHVVTVIEPALQAGKVVVCDRYIPSTLVYGEVSGVSQALLEEWNAEFPAPDLLFLLLPPFEAAWERVRVRGVRDVFEQEQFQRKVYEGYKRYALRYLKATVINTSRSEEESAGEIWGNVGKILG